MATTSELSVTGITVESLYNNYAADGYRINRRYQRKLVWTTDDKEKLVESIFSAFPIPLLLFADIKTQSEKYYEVIDGMQRINAIIYFIENRIAYKGKYFDLDSLSATKSKENLGELIQRTPKLSRSDCLRFTSYIIPSSVYKFDDPTQVDEVFKRINSMGRYLSRQELRAAGTTGEFSTLVRRISANIRGDSSQSDTFSLDKMPYISLAFSEADVGIQVSKIFWIEQGILTKEYLRESRDEEMVCDIIASVALQDLPPSSTDIYNEYYGFPEGTTRSVEVNAAISRLDPVVVEAEILGTLDELRRIFAVAGKVFVDLCFSTPPPRAPRYFICLFLALHTLLYRRSRQISDYVGTAKRLKHICDPMDVGRGGNWSASSKERNIDLFAAAINRCCEDKGVDDPARANWTTRIENILNQSLIEQQLYDFKIGFTDLGEQPTFADSTVAKIVETLTAMTNLGKGKLGYVIAGIADKPADARRVEKLYGISAIERYKRQIVGLAHDCQCLCVSEDILFAKICAVVDKQPIDKGTLNDIKANLKMVSYESRSLLVFQLASAQEPRLFNGTYFIRDGNSNREVKMTDVRWLFSQFS